MNSLLMESAVEYRRPSVTYNDYLKSLKGYSKYDDSEVLMKLVAKSFYQQQTRAQSNSITFDVLNKSYTIPKKLTSLAEHIKESQEILDYTHDWDSEGALPTDAKTFGNSVDFILQYALHLYTRYSNVLITPYIDILRDGSISVHWKNENNAQLLVVINKDDNSWANFYAEEGETRAKLKGSIPLKSKISEILVPWMKNNLT